MTFKYTIKHDTTVECEQLYIRDFDQFSELQCNGGTKIDDCEVNGKLITTNNNITKSVTDENASFAESAHVLGNITSNSISFLNKYDTNKSTGLNYDLIKNKFVYNNGEINVNLPLYDNKLTEVDVLTNNIPEGADINSDVSIIDVESSDSYNIPTASALVKKYVYFNNYGVDSSKVINTDVGSIRLYENLNATSYVRLLDGSVYCNSKNRNTTMFSTRLTNVLENNDFIFHDTSINDETLQYISSDMILLSEIENALLNSDIFIKKVNLIDPSTTISTFNLDRGVYNPRNMILDHDSSITVVAFPYSDVSGNICIIDDSNNTSHYTSPMATRIGDTIKIRYIECYYNTMNNEIHGFNTITKVPIYINNQPADIKYSVIGKENIIYFTNNQIISKNISNSIDVISSELNSSNITYGILSADDNVLFASDDSNVYVYTNHLYSEAELSIPNKITLGYTTNLFNKVNILNNADPNIKTVHDIQVDSTPGSNSYILPYNVSENRKVNVQLMSDVGFWHKNQTINISDVVCMSSDFNGQSLSICDKLNRIHNYVYEGNSYVFINTLYPQIHNFSVENGCIKNSNHDLKTGDIVVIKTINTDSFVSATPITPFIKYEVDLIDSDHFNLYNNGNRIIIKFTKYNSIENEYYKINKFDYKRVLKSNMFNSVVLLNNGNTINIYS